MWFSFSFIVVIELFLIDSIFLLLLSLVYGTRVYFAYNKPTIVTVAKIAKPYNRVNSHLHPLKPKSIITMWL